MERMDEERNLMGFENVTDRKNVSIFCSLSSVNVDLERLRDRLVIENDRLCSGIPCNLLVDRKTTCEYREEMGFWNT
jgi:hypothetical protein